MTTISAAETKSLPLASFHRSHAVKMGSFGGWEVPIYYTSILDEHECVRTKAGLFDISHMGAFLFEGPEARAFLDSLLSASFKNLKPGSAVYSLLTNETGGVIDDVILYEKTPEKFLLIVNAETREKDWVWFQGRSHNAAVPMKDISSGKVLFALQGPKAEKILASFLKINLSSLKRFTFTQAAFQDQEIVLMRTGYTGEDGFEIMAPLSVGQTLWEQLLISEKEEGLAPIGFGARDTLRLEARYPLYGHEMNDTMTPLEAGLGWAVDLTKKFTGSEKIKLQKEKGIPKRLIGFEVLGRQIPRADYLLFLNGAPAGKVTSGCLSPTLKKNIGLGYVASNGPVTGGLEIEIRNEKIPCRIVQGPFYIGDSLKRFKN